MNFNKIKITYIISDIDKALAFEWIATELDKNIFDLSFILLNKTLDAFLQKWLQERQIPVFFVKYESKKDFWTAFWKVRGILSENKTKIIHCHLFDANLVGLLAGKSLGIKRRIFTRHYATLHHQYFPRAVYYDRFINYLATDIVAISKNVENVLLNMENVAAKKITLIYHGLQVETFANPPLSNIEDLKIKYNLKEKYPVIGVVARWTHLKGIQHIIPAFKKILITYPNACLVLANATGDYTDEIEHLLQEIPEKSYIKVAFEQDVPALYHTFDVYVHTPINEQVEAFGQTYVEALATGIPSVFTLSGVAAEFIKHQENALVVDFCDSEAISRAVVEILNDEKKAKALVQAGKNSIKRFYLANFIDETTKLYLK